MANNSDLNGSNDRKYDRQVRIWGDNGQEALSRTSICVINASTVATELLKNLVLAGIASFTIVDGNNVSPEDQATNFFLTPRQSQSADNTTVTDGASLPEAINRGRAVVDAMFELNDSVIGSYIPERAENFLTSSSAARAFVRSFSVVVVTQASQLSRYVRLLSSACAALNIPLVYVRAYGLCAHLRLQMNPYFAVRNARDDATEGLDLHVSTPFPSLVRYAERVDLENQGDLVPFVVLLVRAVQEFRKAHGKLPSNRSEKDTLVKIVESFRPHSMKSEAENYAEALRPAHLRLCHASYEQVPSQVASVLRHPRTKCSILRHSVRSVSPEVTRDGPSLPPALRVARRSRSGIASESGSVGKVTDEGLERSRRMDEEFWICVVAVKSFVEMYDRLPVSGSLPDMTADTLSYIVLQKLYKEQANADALVVLQQAVRFANDYHHALPIPDRRTVETFCRTVRNIRVTSSRTIVQECDASNNTIVDSNSNVQDEENDVENEFVNDLISAVDEKGDFAEMAMAEGAFDPSCANSCAAPFYLALRTADLFEQQHGRLPGTQDSTYEADVSRMQGLSAKVREQLGLSGNDVPSWREVVEEVVRYGGVETHSVAAFIGGVAAQEVTKLATSQFSPLHDTLIINMANMTSVTFRA